MNQNNKNTESKTKADLRLHGGRDRITIRCKPEIKENLLRLCKTNGLSLCHVFETLVTGYLTGMKERVNWVSQSPTIELTVVREVKRIRRYAKEYGAGDVQVETVGSPLKCACGCAEPVVARHFTYVDAQRCVETFVCQRRHEELKAQRVCWTRV